MGVVHACTTVLMRKSEMNLWELVFSFNHVSPGDRTQVFRPASHLTSPPNHLFLRKNTIIVKVFMI